MIIVADPEKRFRTSVGKKLNRPDGSVLDAEDLEAVQSLLQARPESIEIILFGPHIDGGDVLQIARSIQERRPEVSLLLVSELMSAEFLQSALRSGVRDVLPPTFSAGELREAVNRAEAISSQLRGIRPLPYPPVEKERKLISVFSTKGGSGKSFVASNLAVLLAQKNDDPIALVDLDFQSGDLAIILQVAPTYTIHDVAEYMVRLDPARLDVFDEQALRGYLCEERFGVFLLPAPFDPSLADSITPDSVHLILKTLRSAFPYVVVDGPAYFTDHFLTALDDSDECVLVASMDVPNIKNLKLALTTLGQLGMPRERIKVVLNRADSRVGLKVSEVEKSLGTSIDVLIPSSREVPLSINQGTPLAALKRRSPVVGALRKLVELVRVPDSEPSTKKKRPAKK